MLEPNVIVARRAGMLAAGIVLLVADVLLVRALIETSTDVRLPWVPRLHVHEIVLGMWPAAALAGWSTARIVRRKPWLRQVSPVVAFALPCAAAALAAPITVHLIVIVLATFGDFPARDFDCWAALAIALTTVAHVTFTVQVALRAKQLVSGQPAIGVGKIFWVAVVMSSLPAGIPLPLPQVIVAITGIPLLPLLYGMERYARADREAPWVPIARVV